MATVQPTTQAFEEFPRNNYPRADKLEGPALQQALKQQLDFYFSKQNLENDAYLLSQMNPQRYVPVDIIINFRKVRLLTEDRNLIISAMRQCQNLSLDESGNMVRPTWKMERTTLILRDIPASTNVAELQAIFDDAEHKPVNIRSDVGDTWFATFDGEEQCMETALYLSNKTFQGDPVRCRIKPATMVRGYFYPAAQNGTHMMTQQWAGDAMMAQSPGYYPTNMGYSHQYAPYPYNQNVMMQGAYTGGPSQMQQQWQQPYTQHSPSNAHHPNQGNERRPRGTRPDRQNSGGQRDKKDRPDGDRGNRTNQTKGKGRNGERDQRFGRNKGERGSQQTIFSAQPAPILPGPGDFPALPTPTRATRQSSNGNDPNNDTHELMRYTREEMAAIVESVGANFPKPNPDVHTSSVNRTVPITETQILEPMPVMYPASPSPLLAAQTHHSSEMPMLDLNSYGNPYLPPDNPPPHMEFSAVVNSKPPPVEAKKPAEEKAVINKAEPAPAPVKNLASIVAAAAAKEAAAAAAAPPAVVRTQQKSSPASNNRGNTKKGGDNRRAGSSKGDKERGDGRKGKSPQGGRTNKYATKKNTRNHKQPQNANTQNNSGNTSSASTSNAPESPSKQPSYAEMIRRSAAAKAAAANKDKTTTDVAPAAESS